jgi:release factor glutamine methyltransferase
MSNSDEYRPMMSAERARRLRRWHLDADRRMREELPRRMLYLGLDLRIPEEVFPPGGYGELHPLVRAEVKPSDRVLDMGTGSGISGILAAGTSSNVLAVDINPKALDAAAANAARNGVADRISFKRSDIFDSVDGLFDLIIFDPPFRWFKARDLLELSTADENYAALTRFMKQLRSHLAAGGRVLLNFGTSGDIDYLNALIEQSGMKKQVLASRDLVLDDFAVTYFVFRLTPSPTLPTRGRETKA